MHAQIQIFFFVREGGGGGGGVQAKRRKNSLDFLCLFWVFLVQNFPGMRGPTIYGGGGGGGGGGPNANLL